ncbi:MAG: AAA family ATPase [Acidobacteria bacterium]|nr:AAA family ATPase [Acidobacteriota bacterium]MCL5288828.1 AAA family ATPase [Acidobacteriota bacterium]
MRRRESGKPLRRQETHPSILVTWALANAEACLAGSSQIEPIHFFSAVLQILDDAYHQAAERVGLSTEQIRELSLLATEGREIIGIPQDEITRLRRSLQKTRQAAAGPEVMRTLHRSTTARALFDLAVGYAMEEKTRAFTMLHLLRALLLFPSPDLAGVVPRREQTKPALTWETRITRFVDQFELARITIVMSDIESSTLLKSHIGDLESAKLFRTHDTLFREELAKIPEAKEIKSMGDGFLLAFRSETDAVQFALRMQAQLRSHTHLSQHGIKVRFGIHGGEILSRVVPGSNLSDPIFGITIDTTSRILTLAAGDQILTDRHVHDVVAAQLEARPIAGLKPIAWRAHGKYYLKGLEIPVDIYEVGEEGIAPFKEPKSSEKASQVAPETDKVRPVAPRPAMQRATPGIDLFGRDLTALARDARLAPVVGRNKEVKNLARFLQRTTKRNVIVIGEAGVGKTAIVEGLAQRIVAENAPQFLRELRIVQLNVADLVAGAKHRGDMEERIQGILREATSDPNLVLFFDEIHLMLSAGTGGGGALDLANILKPALARDDFRCIGATTTEEFERYVKSDAAFMRRFQVLRVPEPTPAEALEICRKWARRIEEIQGVAFEEDALQAAVTLSSQLIRGRALPDKAIDLLENTAAFVKVSSISLHAAVPTKEAPRIRQAHIENVLEEHYGISASAAKVLDVSAVQREWDEQIVGQAEAGKAIVETLASSARKDDAARPLGIFLFTGPTGVGKTFAAECLARTLFGASADALGRFNMSEFKERHELGRLIGAPPGFLGHEQPGALFRYAESHPQGLILLDEMEKAHPEIQDYFLQIFDKGEAMDSRGRRADFRRYLFVMTCNLIVAPGDKSRIGFHAGDEQQRLDASKATAAKLLSHFRPEFLARIDRVIFFRALEESDFRILLDRRIASVTLEIAERHHTRLEVSDTARERIAALGAGRAEGIRGFEKIVEDFLISDVMNFCKSGPKKAVLRVEWMDDKVTCAWAGE